MVQASKANEIVIEFSKTGLCITVKSFTDVVTRKHLKAIKCDRGPLFQVAKWNRNLTQFRPSEIHYQPDPTERNGSLDM